MLKLNSVTGDEAVSKKLVSLAKDKDKAKKLVIEAGKMLKDAKGKENPFNYNGCTGRRGSRTSPNNTTWPNRSTNISLKTLPSSKTARR